MAWESEFTERMRAFDAVQPRDGMSLSLKVRVTSGCFHREHSPRGYALINQHLVSVPRDTWQFEFVEHESGPELLVSFALATAGLGLAKSVIDLVVAIIQARSDGVRDGDHPSDPTELLVRRIDDGDTFREEIVLRIDRRDVVERAEIEALLEAAVARLASED